jgi:hypothetical protein
LLTLNPEILYFQYSTVYNKPYTKSDDVLL